MGDTRQDVGHERGEPLGLLHALFVGQRVLLELRAGRLVPLDDRDEVGKQLGFRLLADLGPRRVERGEPAHCSDEEQRVGRQRLRRLRRARAVEHGRVGVELGVGDPKPLHACREAVGVGVDHEDRSLAQELAGGHEAAAGRVALPVADDGVAAHQVANALRRRLDLLRPGVGRVRLVVVVAHVHLDATLEQRLDGRGELHRRRRVDEDHAPRPLGDDGQDGIPIRRAEELRADDKLGGDLESEHYFFARSVRPFRVTTAAP